MKIRELTISARAKTCLLAAGYEDIEELESITDEELLNIRNLNRRELQKFVRLLMYILLQRMSRKKYLLNRKNGDCR